MPRKDKESQRSYNSQYHQDHKEKANKRSREYHQNHREESNESRRQWYLAHRDEEQQRKGSLLNSARSRAKAKGVPFDIKEEDINIPEFCPVLSNIRLVRGKGYSTDSSPTIDRICLDRGYVKGNVWVISLRANRIKNDATLEELKLIVSAVEKAISKN